MSLISAEALLDRVAERGFFIPNNPELNLALPLDLSTITSNNLIKEMHTASQMRAYAESQFTMAEIEETRAAIELKQAKAQVYLGLKAQSGMTEKQREAKRDTDENIVAIQERQFEAESYAKLVGTVYRRYEAIYQLLSREISRRGLFKQGLE